MKTHLVIMGALCTILSAIPVHAQLAITNGDFESGNSGAPNSGSLTGWTVAAATTAALPNGGTTSAAIKTAPNTFPNIAQTIGNATTTGKMTITFDAALDSTNCPSSSEKDGAILFRVEDNTTSVFQDFYVTSSQLKTKKFTSISETFDVKEGDSYRIYFYGNDPGSGATAGTYLVDNVVLVVPAPSSSKP